MAVGNIRTGHWTGMGRADKMMNCRKEFKAHIFGKELKCAMIYDKLDIEEASIFALQENFTLNEYRKFLDAIDFDYDEGFGQQYVFGTIWYADGTWSERYEYDGLENWVHMSSPEIPRILKQ